MKIINNVKFDKLYYLKVWNSKGERYITAKSAIDRTTSGSKVTDFMDAVLFTDYSDARSFEYHRIKSKYIVSIEPVPEDVMEKIKKLGLKEYQEDNCKVYMINNKTK